MVFAFCAPGRAGIVTSCPWLAMPQPFPPASGSRPRANGATTAPWPAVQGAVTIHKSQGSGYPAVIIPVLTQHYAMLRRNLLYTGVTRGKRLVVMVGQRKAVA